MSAAEIAVAVIFGAWLAATVVNQFSPGWWARVKERDHFALVPKWTFFAPNPARTDFHLFYRDVLDGDAVGEWCEIPFVPPRTPALRGVWHPAKRQKKVFIDAVRAIVEFAGKIDGEPYAVKVSIPYLILLNYVAALPRGPEVRGRQFMVSETYGWFAGREPRLVFRSDAHRV